MRLRPLLAALCVAATAFAVGPAHAAAPKDLTDVSIIASDGVDLVGDVHLPAAT
ncbi:MAG: hypothetical protein JWO12_3360, partial [Frankiales bacterium]|nr:hypothetical protein [Frankiales bacterium]